MIIVVDSTALSLLINPDARPPNDPATGKPLEHARARILKMIEDMDARADVLIIPTPVLAEVLVRAGDGGPQLAEQLRGRAQVRIKSFTEASAYEVAAMTIEAERGGDKKGGHALPWQRIKFDRQIIAIARVNNASRIYSDDVQLTSFARRLGMSVMSTWELPTPEGMANLFTVAGLAQDGSQPQVLDAPIHNPATRASSDNAVTGRLVDLEGSPDTASVIAENEAAAPSNGRTASESGDVGALEEAPSSGVESDASPPGSVRQS